MSTPQQAEKARQLIAELGDHLPSSLRGPLRRIRDNDEIPGTAEQVLWIARDFLQSLKNRQK